MQPWRRASYRDCSYRRLNIEQLEDRVLLTGSDLALLTATAPASAQLGENIAVISTVTNQGSETAFLPWYEGIYLSQDVVFDESDIYVTADYAGFTVNSLAPGESYTLDRNISLPIGFDAGSAYLLFITDFYGHVQEEDETNNVKAVPIELIAPDVDLVVTALSAPASVKLGDSALVSWTVANQGSESTTGYWYDEIYLSADSSFDIEDDEFVDYLQGSDPVAGGGTYDLSLNVVIPNYVNAGNQFLFLVTGADGTQAESDRSNNYRAVPITLIPPNIDLTVSAVTVPATITSGEPFAVSWTVTNLGAESASRQWYDSVYYSVNPTFDASTAVFLTNVYAATGAPLDPGASYTVSRNLLLPSTASAGYLFVLADFYKYQPEVDETNNARSAPISVAYPDLTMSASAPATAIEGGDISVTFTVTNDGSADATRIWTDALYASTDQTLDASDTLVSYFARPTALAIGANYNVTRDLSLPAAVPTGNYFLLFVADAFHQQPESAVTNNVQALALVIVPAPDAPDLAVTAAQSPGSVSVGDLYQISFRVGNLGTSDATAGWTDAVYLSDAPTLDASATLLFAQAHDSASPLAPGDSYALTRSFRMPADAPTGNRYLLFVTDVDDTQSEARQLNNIKAVPLGVLPKPDLVVSALTAPSTVNVGAPIAVTYTLTNQGAGYAQVFGSNWNESLYFSTDDVLDPADMFVASFSPLSFLNVGGSYTGNQTVTVPTITPGSYYLLLATDAGNQLPEAIETNNVKATPVNVAPALMDLVVTAATAPPSASLGTYLPISFTVRNQGTQAATAIWTDAVYLSTIPTLDATAVRVATFPHDAFFNTVRPVAGGATYTNTNNFIMLPSGVPAGDVYLLLVADANNEQLEGFFHR